MLVYMTINWLLLKLGGFYSKGNLRIATVIDCLGSEVLSEAIVLHTVMFSVDAQTHYKGDEAFIKVILLMFGR